MHTAESLGDLVEVIDAAVLRCRASHVVRHVLRQRSILPAEQQIDPSAPKAVTVHRHDHIAVIEEGGQVFRLCRGHELRGYVASSAAGLYHPVVGGAGPLGRFPSDDVCSPFEVAAVKGTETERRSQGQFFFDAGERQEFSERDGRSVDVLHRASLPDRSARTLTGRFNADGERCVRGQALTDGSAGVDGFVPCVLIR